MTEVKEKKFIWILPDQGLELSLSLTREMSSHRWHLYSRVEWYWTFFAIFENGHYNAGQVYFYEFTPIQKNRRILPHARKSFPFQKITGALKINIFLVLKAFLLLRRTVTKKKFEIKFYLIIF